MAITPQNNEAFFREVDEELRRSQMEGLLRRHGRTALIAVAVGLILLAAFLWWQHHRRVQAEERGVLLSQVITDVSTNPKAAVKPRLDQLAGSGDGGYRAAALLTEAGLALENGDPKAAAAAYGRVAADGNAPQPLRDLAIVRQTATEFDRLPPDEAVRRLSALAVAGSPWFGSAGEMSAIAYLRLNRPKDAARLFGAIGKDKTVPATIRSRAVQMAGLLGVDAIEPPAAGPASR